MNSLLRSSMIATAASTCVTALFFAACGGSNSAGVPFGEGGAFSSGGHGNGTGSASQGSGGTTGEGGEKGSSSNPCQTANDCTTSQPVCHSVTHVCTECETASDCGDGGRCVAGACDVQAHCENTLDCPGALVCSSDNFCVECTTASDCGDVDSACVDNVCHKQCDSDVDCKALGQLCNVADGICAECVETADCDDAEYCSEGECLPDVCEAGETSCNGDAVAQCAEDGASFPVIENCPYGCEVSGGMAECKAPVAGAGCGDPAIIDDMEDGDAAICPSEGRDGQYFYSWDMNYTSSVMPNPFLPTALPASRGTSLTAAHFAGSAGGWGLILGMGMRANAGDVYDGSKYSGITFWARGTSSAALKVQFQTLPMATAVSGGNCSSPARYDCDAFHEASVGVLSSSWTQYTVYFDSLSQPAWLTASYLTAIDLTQLLSVSFWAPSGSGSFDIWVDDVRFVQ